MSSVTFVRPCLVGSHCYAAGETAEFPESRCKRLLDSAAAVSGGNGGTRRTRTVSAPAPAADDDDLDSDPAPNDDAAPTAAALSFEELGIPPRAAKLLRGAGFSTPDQVRAATDEQLIAVKGLAAASVAGIRAALRTDA